MLESSKSFIFTEHLKYRENSHVASFCEVNKLSELKRFVYKFSALSQELQRKETSEYLLSLVLL